MQQFLLLCSGPVIISVWDYFVIRCFRHKVGYCHLGYWLSVNHVLSCICRLVFFQCRFSVAFCDDIFDFSDIVHVLLFVWFFNSDYVAFLFNHFMVYSIILCYQFVGFLLFLQVFTLLTTAPFIESAHNLFFI